MWSRAVGEQKEGRGPGWSGLPRVDLRRSSSGLLNRLQLSIKFNQYILSVFKAASQAISLDAIWGSLT